VISSIFRVPFAKDICFLYCTIKDCPNSSARFGEDPVFIPPQADFTPAVFTPALFPQAGDHQQEIKNKEIKNKEIKKEEDPPVPGRIYPEDRIIF
jgi:hypothetical protein